MDHSLTIGGEVIGANQAKVVRLPVTVDLNDHEVAVSVHVTVGARPGPTLALLSTSHGGEWQSIEIVRRVVSSLDPAQMQGNVLAVPVANPIALAQLTRSTPDESDNQDLNRVFPGQYTWLTEQLASTIAQHVMQPADALIDYHMGLWGASLATVMCGSDYEDPDVVSGSKAMAKAYGWPCIHESKVLSVFPGPRSATGYFGGVLGRPCIVSEIGGAGFDLAIEEGWLDANVQGVFGVMRHLGILSGEVKTPEKYLVFENRWRVNPSKGGYLLPAIGPERMLTEVKEGETLGSIISPYTLQEIERLQAPGRGTVFYLARSYPVRPGDWAFGLIKMDDPKTRWEAS